MRKKLQNEIEVKHHVERIERETNRRIAEGAEPDRALMAATFLYCMSPVNPLFPEFKKALFQAIREGRLPKPYSEFEKPQFAAVGAL